MCKGKLQSNSQGVSLSYINKRLFEPGHWRHKGRRIIFSPRACLPGIRFEGFPIVGQNNDPGIIVPIYLIPQVFEFVRYPCRPSGDMGGVLQPNYHRIPQFSAS